MTSRHTHPHHSNNIMTGWIPSLRPRSPLLLLLRSLRPRRRARAPMTSHSAGVTCPPAKGWGLRAALPVGGAWRPEWQWRRRRRRAAEWRDGGRRERVALRGAVADAAPRAAGGRRAARRHGAGHGGGERPPWDRARGVLGRRAGSQSRALARGLGAPRAPGRLETENRDMGSVGPGLAGAARGSEGAEIGLVAVKRGGCS